MVGRTEASEFRREVVDLYDEYTALRALAGNLTVEEYEGVKRSRLALTINFRTGVRKAERDLRRQVSGLRRQMAVKADRRQLIELLRTLEDGTTRPILYVAKPYLDELADYSRVIADYDRLPLHGRVGLSVRRTTRENPGELGLWLLEEKLYEDMCVLFNQCHDLYPRATAELRWKPFEAVARATVVAAFSFVEAYLNGLADDFLLGSESVAEKTKTLLTEWDEKRNRNQYLTFREKALSYPRVYAQVKHALLQENNCPELELLVRMSKVRDSLVHASVLRRGHAASKENVFFDLSWAQVQETVDAAVMFVKRAERETGRNSLLLDWIIERNSAGRFSDKAFD